MKKWVVFVGFLGGVAIGVQAQSIGTMWEQIVALKAFIKTAEKGYALADQGLRTIRDIRDGEFHLHSTYFSSLRTVNPVVRDMPELAEILRLEGSITAKLSALLEGYRAGGWLNVAELALVGQFYDGLVKRGMEESNALADLTTDGRLEMDDGERIQRVQALDKDLRDRYGVVLAFIGQADLLVQHRQKAAAELQGIKSWYGLK